jgi:hypothetical protein
MTTMMVMMMMMMMMVMRMMMTMMMIMMMMMLHRSRAPRPSLLGEALGLTGSDGRGQAFWARRCQ